MKILLTLSLANGDNWRQRMPGREFGSARSLIHSFYPQINALTVTLVTSGLQGAQSPAQVTHTPSTVRIVGE